MAKKTTKKSKAMKSRSAQRCEDCKCMCADCKCDSKMCKECGCKC